MRDNTGNPQTPASSPYPSLWIRISRTTTTSARRVLIGRDVTGPWSVVGVIPFDFRILEPRRVVVVSEAVSRGSSSGVEQTPGQRAWSGSHDAF